MRKKVLKKDPILTAKTKFINSVNRRKLKKKTKFEYIRIIKSIDDKYIKKKDLELFKKDLLKKKSPKTTALYCSVLRNYFNFHKIEYKNIPVYTSSRGIHLKDSFTEQELKRLHKNADEFIKSMIICLYYTGLRISELINGELIRNKKYYRLSFMGKGKTKAEDFIIYKSKKFLCSNLETFYNPAYKDRRVYYSIWKDFRDLKLRCGFTSKKLTIHSIRHSAAERFKQNFGELTAQRMLRHRDFRTTEIYINNDSTVLK